MTAFACPHCGNALSVRVYALGAGAAIGEGDLALPFPAPHLGRQHTDGRHPENVAAIRAQVKAKVAQTAARAEDQRQDRAHRRAAAAQECPVHHRATQSRFGGLYCPMPGDGKNGWCTWKATARGKNGAA